MRESVRQTDQEVAIEISHVSKIYRLGEIGGRTLQRDLQSWWARVRGKEDPNLRVGQTGHVRGERFCALDDINLRIYKGEALGIIGRNGAGKSTLLKLLSRVTAPSEGEIKIYGRIASMLEVGTGFHGEMTGRENVYLNGSILGMTRHEIDEKVDDIIEFSEIGKFIDTPVKRYSSGMYVKLAFAVAAHLNCDIMIMDEVLAVGDVMFRNKSLAKMQDEAGSGKTVLYVSHNMSTIRQLCNRCAVLHEGKLVFLGDTEKAIEVYHGTILDPSVCRDLSVMPRSARLTSRKMMLTMAEFVGKDSIQFEDGEPMVMHLHWENLEDYEHLCVRMEIYTIDDVVLASGMLYDVCSGVRGESEDLTIRCDISQFACATYKTKFTFFFVNEHGTVQDTDRVIGLFFERVSKTEDAWDLSHWGYVKLEGLEVVQ